MTGWLVFGLVAVLIVGLMLIRLRLVIELDDSFALQLKVLWLTFHIIPAKKKDEKINLRDYEIKRVKKKEEQARKKKRKLALKSEKKRKKAQNVSEEKSEETKEKTDVLGIVKLIFAILKDLKAAAIGYVGIDLERMYIVVSSDDAANTAILYGAISQGANLLFEFLRNITGFRMTGRPEDIAVIPDFTFGKLTAKLKLIIRIRVWQIFALAFKMLFSFIRYQMKNNSSQTINQTAEEEQHG